MARIEIFYGEKLEFMVCTICRRYFFQIQNISNGENTLRDVAPCVAKQRESLAEPTCPRNNNFFNPPPLEGWGWDPADTRVFGDLKNMGTCLRNSND